LCIIICVDLPLPTAIPLRQVMLSNILTIAWQNRAGALFCHSIDVYKGKGLKGRLLQLQADLASFGKLLGKVFGLILLGRLRTLLTVKVVRNSPASPLVDPLQMQS